MRFDERVYGPHPIPAAGRRVLLAHPGRDYNAAEAAAIRAAAEGATVDEVNPADSNGDSDSNGDGDGDSNGDGDGDSNGDGDTPVVVHRGGGWYEVTATGERVHGRAKADEAAAAAEAGGGASG